MADSSCPSNARRRILLVGAGAVGQAYGWHLQQAGHDVSFFIKPNHRQGLSTGVDISCLSGRFKGQHRFSGYGLYQEADELQGQTWDDVWLCMSSTGLRGPWLEPLLGAVVPLHSSCYSLGSKTEITCLSVSRPIESSVD